MAERLPVGRGEESGREQQPLRRRRASIDTGWQPRHPPAAGALRRCQSDPQLFRRCLSEVPAGGVLRRGEEEKGAAGIMSALKPRASESVRFVITPSAGIQIGNMNVLDMKSWGAVDSSSKRWSRETGSYIESSSSRENFRLSIFYDMMGETDSVKGEEEEDVYEDLSLPQFQGPEPAHQACPPDADAGQRLSYCTGGNPDHVSEPMIMAQSDAPVPANESKGRKTKVSTSTGERTRCSMCHSEDLSETVEPDVIWDSQRRREIYKLCCTEPGTFRCCYTDLIFEVRGAVSIVYHGDSWQEHLSATDAQNLMVAGPLLNIQAEPKEAVAAVFFPHFLCLAGSGRSRVQIAHFVDGNMSLENPDSVEPFHVILRNPRFSPRGVVFRKSWWKRKKKVHAMVMLYQVLGISVSKFHFYLLPNESVLRKSVHDHETKCGSQRLEKPSWTLKPLTMGFCYFVQELDGVVICPKELEFRYTDADMEQQYLELYAKKVQDTLELKVMEKNKDELVWTAYVRQDELLSVSSYPVQDQHFIERYRDQLIQRTTNVEGILDVLLQRSILDGEQYQTISRKGTCQDKMRELFNVVRSWNKPCKDQLYEILKVKQRFLMEDLEQ